jgi:drug/metabolite transporter (DMT)-like permease
LFIALSVIWGIPYLLIRVAVTDLSPVVVAGSRTLIGALLLLPMALFRR